jgi:hypothetical protein
MGSIPWGLPQVALTQRRTVLIMVLLATAIAMLGYLRDPPWLLSTTSGLRAWETEADGTRVRWMGGHASLFVPASAHAVELPVRTTFEGSGDWPVTVTVAIDDRMSDRIVLSDGAWHSIQVQLPPAGHRKVRRLDIRLDRTRDDNHGAAVGELRIR